MRVLGRRERYDVKTFLLRSLEFVKVIKTLHISYFVFCTRISYFLLRTFIGWYILLFRFCLIENNPTQNCQNLSD
jgi:hypothetical protein